MTNITLSHVENHRIDNLKLRPLVTQGGRWSEPDLRRCGTVERGCAENANCRVSSGRPDGIEGS